jgi:hypothetical protein
MREGVIETILLECPNLNELDIILPWELDEVLKTIYEKCTNLERLAICPSNRKNHYNQKFYRSRFFTSNHRCKSILKHLTLNSFEVSDSKSEYFNNFKNLKSIIFPGQEKNYYCPLEKIQKIGIDMDLWPGYKLLLKNADCGSKCDIELKKI